MELVPGGEMEQDPWPSSPAGGPGQRLPPRPVTCITPSLGQLFQDATKTVHRTIYLVLDLINSQVVQQTCFTSSLEAVLVK